MSYTGILLQTTNLPSDSQWSLAFGDDGKLYAMDLVECRLAIVNQSTGVFTFKAQDPLLVGAAVTSLCWHPAGYLLFGTEHSFFGLIDPATGQVVGGDYFWQVTNVDSDAYGQIMSGFDVLVYAGAVEKIYEYTPPNEGDPGPVASTLIATLSQRGASVADQFGNMCRWSTRILFTYEFSSFNGTLFYYTADTFPEPPTQLTISAITTPLGGLAYDATNNVAWITSGQDVVGQNLYKVALADSIAGFTATKSGIDVVLTWTAFAGADHYKISKDGGAFGSNVTSGTKDIGAAGQFHLYIVRAYDASENILAQSSTNYSPASVVMGNVVNLGQGIPMKGDLMRRLGDLRREREEMNG